MLSRNMIRHLTRQGGKKPRHAPFEVSIPPWSAQMEDWFLELCEEYPELRWKLEDLKGSLYSARHAPENAPSYSVPPADALDTLLTFMQDEFTEGYPSLTAPERKAALKEMTELLDNRKFASDDHANAVAIRLAAPRKYKRFEEKRER